MLRSENTLAAKRLVDSLRTTIATSAESLDSVKRSFDHRPHGNLMEAKSFCDTVKKEVNQLRDEIAPIQTLMKVPAAGDLLDAGFQQLDVIDNILDLFEVRLQQAYGIEIKVDEEKKEGECDIPAEVVCDVEETTNVTARVESKTPVRVSPKFEDVMPATPKLEDFGISSADIEALQAGPTQRKIGGTQCASGLASTGVEIGSGDYGEAVAKSMSALGIETPVQVADKFSARRHIALKGVMPGTTPRMRDGVVLDYTRLAGGYYEGRQLDFGDEDDGLRERYDQAEGYWKETVSADSVIKAAGIVKMNGGGRQDEVLEAIRQGMGGVDALGVLVGLTKMKVLSVEKMENGVAVYRHRG